MALLQVRHITQKVGRRTLLHDVSFSADAGKVVVFLGPNGAGKTTLLRTVVGLLPYYAPSDASAESGIIYADEQINSWHISRRVQAGLVYLPQHSSLFERLSVWDNLVLVYEHHRYWRTPRGQTSWLRMLLSNVVGAGRWREFEEQAELLLDQVSLSHAKLQRAGELSGGQKRKLEVVRALLLQPKMILLDEPFAGVDPKSIYELKELFVHLAKSGIGVLISDHHVDQLLSIADYVYVVCEGKIIAQGNVQEIMHNQHTQDMYLGGQFHAEMAKRFLNPQ